MKCTQVHAACMLAKEAGTHLTKYGAVPELKRSFSMIYPYNFRAAVTEANELYHKNVTHTYT